MSKQEKLVIIFLLSCAVVGLAVSFYRKARLPEIRVVPCSVREESAHLENRILSRHLVNINTSDADKLTLLPGIGPALAEKIVAYRRKNGFFLSPEDITKVSGIGETKYESIKDSIIVEYE